MGSLSEPWNTIQCRGSAELGQALRRLIRTGSVGGGDPLPSERALAEGLGISRTTVRVALAELENEGLVVTGHKRVRRVADTAMSPLLEHAVAVLADQPVIDPRLAPQQPGWPAHVQAAAASRLQHDGWQALASVVFPDVEQATQRVIRLRPAGIVVAFDCSEPGPAQRVLPLLDGSGTPFVIHCNASHDLTQYDRVCTSHEIGGKLLGERIAASGGRHVIRLYRSPVEPPWLAARDAGLSQALNEVGLPEPRAIRAERFAEVDDLGSANNFDMFSRLFFSYLFEMFKEQPEIDSIVTLNDRHAYEIGRACEMLGRRPHHDVMIFGYDNCWAEAPEREYLDNPVSATIDKHYAQIGHELANLMIARLGGELPDNPQSLLVEPTLVIPEAT